ncbi:topless-related protein 4-like protein isoform X1 [Tanacetum coccineum]
MARRRHGKRAAPQIVLILRAKSDSVPGTLGRGSPHMSVVRQVPGQRLVTSPIRYHPRWWPEGVPENRKRLKGTNPNKSTRMGMFKDQDEIVVAQDEVVQEKLKNLFICLNLVNGFQYLQDDANLLTACGDHSVPELNMYLRIPDVIVSGSRDGFDNRFHILISKDVVDVEVICYVEELKSVQELSERMIIFLLQVAPCIRFNKEGIIMVVSTKENGITILANPNEIGLLQTMEICRSFNQSRVEGLIPIDIITMMMTVSDMEAGFDGIMREEKHRCFVPRSCLGKHVTLARELMEDEAEQFLLHDDMMMPTGHSRMSLKNHR